jgi:molybdopterin converting factor small subunit
MQTVLVRYYGILKEFAKKKQEKIEMEDNSSVLDLIKVISARNGEKFRDFVSADNGKMRDGLAFAVDGKSVERSTLGRIKCKDISEFVILPPISGGTLLQNQVY